MEIKLSVTEYQLCREPELIVCTSFSLRNLILLGFLNKLKDQGMILKTNSMLDCKILHSIQEL